MRSNLKPLPPLNKHKMELQKKQRFSDTNREDLLTYLEQGGPESGIELTPKQVELMDRHKHADQLIRSGKYKRETVANMIIAKYAVSRDTAYNDIINADHVFY